MSEENILSIREFIDKFDIHFPFIRTRLSEEHISKLEFLYNSSQEQGVKNHCQVHISSYEHNEASLIGIAGILYEIFLFQQYPDIFNPSKKLSEGTKIFFCLFGYENIFKDITKLLSDNILLSEALKLESLYFTISSLIGFKNNIFIQNFNNVDNNYLIGKTIFSGVYNIEKCGSDKVNVILNRSVSRLGGQDFKPTLFIVESINKLLPQLRF